MGALLGPVLATEPVGNFQDWPPWRGVVVATATQVLRYTGGTLLIPQTVLSEEYWAELSAGFAEQDVPVRHVLLHCAPDTLTHRIRTDTAPESAAAGPGACATASRTARPCRGCAAAPRWSTPRT